MASNAHERVVVLDFGGQYAQLIARRVRDLGVYCEIKSYKTNPEELRDCKASFSPEVLTAFTAGTRPFAPRRFLSWEFPCWASATAPR